VSLLSRAPATPADMAVNRAAVRMSLTGRRQCTDHIHMTDLGKDDFFISDSRDPLVAKVYWRDNGRLFGQFFTDSLSFAELLGEAVELTLSPNAPDVSVLTVIGSRPLEQGAHLYTGAFKHFGELLRAGKPTAVICNELMVLDNRLRKMVEEYRPFY
jgi:hypothetical protein